MTEITLTVTLCDEYGFLVASWNEPDGTGGITTQARDLQELENNVREAVAVHFDPGGCSGADPSPLRSRLCSRHRLRLPRDISGVRAVKALERLGFRSVRQIRGPYPCSQGKPESQIPRGMSPGHESLAAETLQNILSQAGLDTFLGSYG